MTRKQQEEIKEIIKNEGGRLEEHGFEECVVKECPALYTWEIKRIIELGGNIYYNEGELRITNWTSYPPTKPEEQQEMKVRAFRDGEYDLILRAVKDPNRSMNHDHVELWSGGKKLGYMHINKKRMQWWAEDTRFSNDIRISGDC